MAHLFHLFDRAHRRFRKDSELVFQQRAGVPVAQVGALFALFQRKRLSLNELAAELGIQKASTSTLVNRMEQAKLVQRTPDPNDARAVQLSLTAYGKRVASRALPVVHDANAALLQQFSEEELETVARFFRAVLERPRDDSKGG